MKFLTSSLGALVVSGALLAVAQTSQAQTEIYSQNFDVNDTANWAVNATAGYNPADIYFDYSTAGIPPAPHSPGTTRGLKLQANLDVNNQFFGGVSVSPIGFGITDNFEMHWDMWINYNNGNGSTQVGGAGYGTAGTNAQVAGMADSVFIGATGDGGSGADFRVYSPGKAVSYQAGQYIIGGGFNSDFTVLNPGDSSSGFVYAGNAGGRNNSDGGATGYYATNFPAGNTPPAAQITLFPSQSGLSTLAGAVGMKWRDVSIRKIANRMTYRIDGVLIATIDAVDAITNTSTGTVIPLGGTNILFNHYDIALAASTDPNATNMAFSLIDNVRVTNFPTVVTVTATAPNASEQGPVPGTFTVTRTSTGVPLTVDYTLLGTATSNVDYTIDSPSSVTFLPTATTTNVTITPIDDAIAETTETVILSLNDSTNFVGAGSATVTIADNEAPQLAITNVSKQMYERTNDFATFRITRLGDTNVASFNANISFSGTATYGVDYYTNTLVPFDPGVQSTNFNVLPVQDLAYEGNETVTVNIAAAGAGEYSIGAASSASITLVDGNEPAETVLFSDNFNTVGSSTNWDLKFGATNVLDQDYTAEFAYNYGGQNIPPAPYGGGDTLGLYLAVNKDATAAAAALNLYPIGKSFSGNFALKFNMFLNMAPGSSSTEYALFGINHSGNNTNWWRNGGVPAGWTFDGIFYAVETDAAQSPHYVNYSSPTTNDNPTALTSGTNVSGFTDAFKSPPWAVAGSPAMIATNNTPVWSDVELSQIGNIVTLRINHTTIFSYTNATAYTAGNIMIGYEDAFDSLGTIQNYVVYDNVRVVRLEGLEITAIQDLGANVQLDFTFDLNDAPSSFKVQSASVVTGPYADTAATIVQFAPGTYRATVLKSGGVQFYRIRHL